MNKKADKKKKTASQSFVGMALFMILGAVCGVMIGKYLVTAIDEGRAVSYILFQMAELIVIMYLVVFVQTIIHEAGHMVFGMMTGYRFCSFRIFSFMWIKQQGKLRFRRLAIAGTGGQCLMAPPDLRDGKIPVMLYNLGGAFLNIAAGIVFIGLSFVFDGMPFVGVIMKMGAVVGFAFAIINGVPMRMGMVDNDGRNVLTLSRSLDAQYSFWLQMKVNEQISEGIRIKDLPEEWFAVPADEDMKNSLTAVRGVLACNRLMDMQHFDEADQLIEHLLNIDSGIAGLHRHLMICDRMYIELIGENRSEVLDEMRTKEQKKLMNAMKNYPSVLRTEYAYALLAQHDDAKADKIKARFEKCAAAYPYPVEAVGERELLDLAQKLSGRIRDRS